MFKGKLKAGAKFNSNMIMKNNGIEDGIKLRGDWSIKCIRNGKVVWEENYKNLITNAGRDYALDAALSGGTPLTSWFIGLVSGATPTFAAADTMASHGGWTEFTDYDEATREAWTDAGVSGGSANNSGSVAEFTMNAGGTIGGAFLVSNSTKGGTTGTLYAEGDFPTDRTVISSDVLQVTATFSAQDDGV